MWAILLLFGIYLSLRGLYFFARGVIVVLKCIFIYFFASKKFVDKEFDKLVEKEFSDYRSFENELKEMLNN